QVLHELLEARRLGTGIQLVHEPAQGGASLLDERCQLRHDGSQQLDALREHRQRGALERLGPGAVLRLEAVHLGQELLLGTRQTLDRLVVLLLRGGCCCTALRGSGDGCLLQLHRLGDFLHRRLGSKRERTNADTRSCSTGSDATHGCCGSCSCGSDVQGCRHEPEPLDRAVDTRVDVDDQVGYSRHDVSLLSPTGQVPGRVHPYGFTCYTSSSTGYTDGMYRTDIFACPGYLPPRFPSFSASLTAFSSSSAT